MRVGGEECRNCLYWVKADQDGSNGTAFILFFGRKECRRRSPVMYAIQPDRAWPQTMPTDWCGEWQQG